MLIWNENCSSMIEVSLKCVPNATNNNIPSLVQIMAWHRRGKSYDYGIAMAMFTFLWAVEFCGTFWLKSNTTWCPSINQCMADFRFAPSQWETSLQSNAVSHWLGANLDSALPVLSYHQMQCWLNFWYVLWYHWFHSTLFCLDQVKSFI